jgi:hypothetical protein
MIAITARLTNVLGQISPSARLTEGGLTMCEKPSFLTRRGVLPISAAAAIAVACVVLGGRAISGQDKYTVQVPNGLAFSEFRGYEDWSVIAIRPDRRDHGESGND